MKKTIPFLSSIVLLLLLSCQTDIKDDLELLKGYWEIETVKEKGDVFSLNNNAPLYDFYSFEENKGIRKKVKPLFDGSFETSADETEFQLQFNDKKVILQFLTPWNTWEEEIVLLNKKTLVLQHQGRTYHYKKATLITIEDE